MKIGLDLRMLEGGSGISRYISEISHAILSQDKDNSYVLFFRNESASESYKQYGQKIVIADIAHYSIAEQLIFPRILKAEKLDLVHFPHFNVPIYYKGKFVVTIHDLTHTKFPGRKKTHFFHRLAYNTVIAAAIKKSAAIIAVSQSTKKEILDYYGVAPEKIHVIYEGVNQNYNLLDKDEAFEYVTNRFKIAKPYILYVGVWRRYKNLSRLAFAFELLKEKAIDAQLVLVGDEDPFYPEIRREIFLIKHAADIVALGRVSDPDLNYIYNAASLYVQPSLVEGFGLTTLEAANCGVPIACSDIPTHREILGQAAEYFDPENVENMADVMQRILQDEKHGEDLANLLLRRASHFDWKKSGLETVNLYNQVFHE